jgi:formate/nitrite transporter
MAESVTRDYDPKLSPKEVSKTITSAGVVKATTSWWQLFVLGILAGIYISIGGHTYLIAREQGMGLIVAGAVFSLGLVLVVIAGAELFTGNVLMILGFLHHRFGLVHILKNWVVVWLGNLVGALAFVLLVFKAQMIGPPENLNTLGQLAATVCEKKMALSPWVVFLRGIPCNMLVVLAVILALFCKDVVSKICAIILPIMAFVAAGYEHCVANMYLIPLGMSAKGVAFQDQWVAFANILPATLGNIVGGLFIVLAHPERLKKLWIRVTGSDVRQA